MNRIPLFLLGVTVVTAGALLYGRAPVASPLNNAAFVSVGETPRAEAAVEESTIGPRQESLTPFPVIEAKSAAVVDGETGVLLGEKEKDGVFPIASVTKLMTALVFLDTQPSWERVITMKSGDNRPGGTLFVRPGERVTTRDVFMTALVGSANNAAVALMRASDLSLEAFVQRMQERAVSMGLSATQFAEPTGLEAGNVSSALDLVRLGWHAFQHPAIREALTSKEHVFFTVRNNIRHRVKTTNDLLFASPNGYTIVGAKTGFTNEAGYTFVIEAKNGENRVIVALLGAPTEEDRFRDADTLVRWAFANYRWGE